MDIANNDLGIHSVQHDSQMGCIPYSHKQIQVDDTFHWESRGTLDSALRVWSRPGTQERMDDPRAYILVVERLDTWVVVGALFDLSLRVMD